MIRSTLVALGLAAVLALPHPARAQAWTQDFTIPDVCFAGGPCMSFGPITVRTSTGLSYLSFLSGNIYGNTPTYPSSVCILFEYVFAVQINNPYRGECATVGNGPTSTSIVGAGWDFFPVDPAWGPPVGGVRLAQLNLFELPPLGGSSILRQSCGNVGGATPCVTVPEPSSLLLLASGMVGVLSVGWRRRRELPA